MGNGFKWRGGGGGWQGQLVEGGRTHPLLGPLLILLLGTEPPTLPRYSLSSSEYLSLWRRSQVSSVSLNPASMGLGGVFVLSPHV